MSKQQAKIDAMIIDVETTNENEMLKKITVLDDLATFYLKLHCDTIDIVDRRIGNKYFTLIIDDNGLLKENNRTSIIDINRMPMIVGNVIICHADENGELISLDDEDYEILEDHAYWVTYEDGKTGIVIQATY